MRLGCRVRSRLSSRCPAPCDKRQARSAPPTQQCTPHLQLARSTCGAALLQLTARTPLRLRPVLTCKYSSRRAAPHMCRPPSGRRVRMRWTHTRSWTRHSPCSTRLAALRTRTRRWTSRSRRLPSLPTSTHRVRHNPIAARAPARLLQMTLGILCVPILLTRSPRSVCCAAHINRDTR